jgi:hypothetical protein
MGSLVLLGVVQKMYSIGNDTVMEIDDVPLPDSGAPLPIVHASEDGLRIAYYVADGDSRWKESHTKRSSESDDIVVEDCVAIVTCHGIYAHVFGPPNDEAYSGHPLSERGLHPYGVFEVKESSWIRALVQMNSVHQSHSPEAFSRYRHFIISFHDSTFECVGHSLSFEIFNGDVSEVFLEKLRRGSDLRST